MFSCHALIAQLLLCRSAVLVNCPGVAGSNPEQSVFFAFLFFSVIFAEDEEPLGLSFFKTQNSNIVFLQLLSVNSTLGLSPCRGGRACVSQ